MCYHHYMKHMNRRQLRAKRDRRLAFMAWPFLTHLTVARLLQHTGRFDAIADHPKVKQPKALIEAFYWDVMIDPQDQELVNLRSRLREQLAEEAVQV